MMCLGLPFFLRCQQSPRARKPPGGRGMRACGDPEEKDGQRRVKLVAVNTTRYAQHVRDVLRAGAGRARGREGSTAQTNERPIPVLTREERRRAPTTSHCRPAHPGRRGGKKLLGPGEVLVFLRREHREDEGRRPQKRVEHVTRSPATKRAQVSSSTPEPA